MKVWRGAGLLLATAGYLAAGNRLPDALAAGWQGKPVCVVLQQDAVHRLLRCTFPPGVGHERHYHPAHFGYALSGGTMRITDARGTRVQHLKTGSDYASKGTPWHEVVNIGTTTVEYLIFEQRDPDPAPAP